MSIRKMLEKDLPAILKMTSKEGWISDRVEFNTFIDINPSGCFVYSEKNKVIGLITTFCHTTSAWIGNFIISKKYRGKGIGSKLLAKSIEYLNTKKKKQIYLNASKKAESLYEKFGFKKVMCVNRWQGSPAKSANISGDIKKTIIEKTVNDISDFIILDACLWKDNRSFLIFLLSSLNNSIINYKKCGFLMYGKVGSLNTISAWEIENANENIAEQLFVSALLDMNSKSKVILDVPAKNKTAEKILISNGFKINSSTAFMCLGRLPEIRFNEIFSFATMGSKG